MSTHISSGSDEQNIVVGAKNHRFNIDRHSKTFKIVAATVLALILAGTATLVIIQLNRPAPPPNLLKSTYIKPDQLQEYYDQSIQSANNPLAKANAYFQKGLLYSSRQDYQSALQLVLKANSLAPNNRVYLEQTGFIYSKLGNTQKAATYYGLCLQNILSDQTISSSDKSYYTNYYQEKIQALVKK